MRTQRTWRMSHQFLLTFLLGFSFCIATIRAKPIILFDVDRRKCFISFSSSVHHFKTIELNASAGDEIVVFVPVLDVHNPNELAAIVSITSQVGTGILMHWPISFEWECAEQCPSPVNLIMFNCRLK